ncbi:MAG: hypothetical protein OXC26_18425 [Albidovulum sp.]|nr:hypothetical protein [Albidovulum sp.]
MRPPRRKCNWLPAQAFAYLAGDESNGFATAPEWLVRDLHRHFLSGGMQEFLIGHLGLRIAKVMLAVTVIRLFSGTSTVN